MKNILRVVALSVFMTVAFTFLPAASWSDKGPEVLKTSDLDLHPKAQFELFKKVLFYERSLKDRATEGLVIGLLYEHGDAASDWTMETFARAVLENPGLGIDDITVRAVPLDLDKIDDFGTMLKKEKVDFLYVAPLNIATERNKLRGVLHDCERMKVPTFTGTISYVDIGVAVGFALKANHPEVRVNLAASRAQGFIFSAQFLKTVGVI